MTDLDELMAGEPEDTPALSALKDENSRLRKKIRQAQGQTELVIDAVREFLDENPPRVPKVTIPKARTRKGRDYWALLHCSDWQVGALSPDYDTSKAREAVALMLAKLVKVIDENYGRDRFKGIHIVYGGDMVDGSGKRPSHSWDVDSDVMEQAMVSTPEMMASVYNAAAELFPEVHACSQRGNHGDELGKASRNPKRVNWDTVAARVAEKLIGASVPYGPKHTFSIEVDRFYQVLQLGKTGVLCMHGDQFRGSGGFAGIPYYAIAKKMAKWQEAIPGPREVLIFGHYHVPAFGMFGKRLWFLNGSTMPTNEWALETLAATSRPAQRLLVVDDERGVIADHVLWLDD